MKKVQEAAQEKEMKSSMNQQEQEQERYNKLMQEKVQLEQLLLEVCHLECLTQFIAVANSKKLASAEGSSLFGLSLPSVRNIHVQIFKPMSW